MDPREMDTDLAEYVDGTLPEEKARLLEERLKNDPALREEIELARFARTTLKALPQAEPPVDLVDRILERTTRRPALARRVMEWFRAIPAPAYALAMVAVIAGTIVYHLFGTTLSSETDIATVSQKGLPLKGLKPVATGLPPDTATYESSGDVTIIRQGPSIEVHIMTKTPADEAPPARPEPPKAAAAEKDRSGVLSVMDTRVKGAGGGGIGRGTGGGYGVMGSTTRPDMLEKNQDKTKSIAKLEASAPPPAPAPAAPVSTLATGGLREETAQDMPPYMEEDRNVSEAEAEPNFDDNKAAETYPAGKAAPARSPRAVAEGQEGKRAVSSKESEKSVRDETSGALPIIQRIEGRNSGWTREGTAFITSASAFDSLWRKIWSTRLQPPPLPLVNFKHQAVVAVGMGTQPTGGFSIRITSVERKGNVIQVRFTRQEPAEGSIVTESMTSPFSLVIVDLGGPVEPDLRVEFTGN